MISRDSGIIGTGQGRPSVVTRLVSRWPRGSGGRGVEHHFELPEAASVPPAMWTRCSSRRRRCRRRGVDVGEDAIVGTSCATVAGIAGHVPVRVADLPRARRQALGHEPGRLADVLQVARRVLVGLGVDPRSGSWRRRPRRRRATRAGAVMVCSRSMRCGIWKRYISNRGRRDKLIGRTPSSSRAGSWASTAYFLSGLRFGRKWCCSRKSGSAPARPVAPQTPAL